MSRHHEPHRLHRVGWLRAAVLGANDGIVSTASLIIGVAAAAGTRDSILVAGVAGLVAGAMSMAAGEYVSVSSQADAESADLARECLELANDASGEHAELAGIYRGRGLDTPTADAVATQLMAKDALGAHARDELGISDFSAAQPIQAAFASAAAFTVGAALPLALALFVPVTQLVITIAIASLIFLALLGAVGALAGGASLGKPMLRVTFWGAMAMLLTAGIGNLVGGVV
jgi:VIT1/CCC1 family predicted Fe2+/Mn2+ transporter